MIRLHRLFSSSVIQGGCCVSRHEEALGSELIAGHSVDGVPSFVGGNVVLVAVKNNHIESTSNSLQCSADGEMWSLIHCSLTLKPTTLKL